MVVKKPYAFLIRNFRLIHAVLFAMLLYLTMKTFGIYSFFSDYATNHYYINTSNLASDNVTFLMFLAAIVALVVSLVIYFILALKKKSTKIYLAISIYLVILIIFFAYMSSVFGGLETESLDVESDRALRDISVIVLLPQIVFLFIILGRTLGFNLKQFDFKRDLEELQIDQSDYEEVEVTLGTDTYKIARTLRKSLRYLKYIMIENKLFMICIISVFIFGVSVYAISKFDIPDVEYSNGEFLASSAFFNVKDNCYITNTDMNNNVIKEGKYYLLINVKVSNKYANIVTLTRQTFRLDINGELLIPNFNVNDKFVDLGDMYNPGDIQSGEDKEFYVIFEIDEKDLSSEYILKINNTSSVDSNYKDILVAPTDLTKINDKGTLVLPNEISFDDLVLGKSKLSINSYEISDKFKEKYNYCVNDNCNVTTFSIIPESTNKGSLAVLKLKTTLEMDKSVYVNKIIKYPEDLFNYYGFIRYRYMGKYKTVKLDKINTDIFKNEYSYFEIPQEVINSNKIELILLIRGIKYTFILKNSI